MPALEGWPVQDLGLLQEVPREVMTQTSQKEVCLPWAREVVGVSSGPQWCPGKPLEAPFPGRQYLPVRLSSKPKFEKVPTVSSSQISNHFLSSSQDLSWGDALSEQDRPSWDHFAALTPIPNALICLSVGRLCWSAQRRCSAPAAAAEPRPPSGPVPSRRQPPCSAGPRTSACPWRSSWSRGSQARDPHHLLGRVR